MEDKWWENLSPEPIVLSKEDFDEFVSILERPPRQAQRLKALFERGSVFEKDSPG